MHRDIQKYLNISNKEEKGILQLKKQTEMTETEIPPPSSFHGKRPQKNIDQRGMNPAMANTEPGKRQELSTPLACASSKTFS